MIAPGFRGLDKNADRLLIKDEVKSFTCWGLYRSDLSSASEAR